MNIILMLTPLIATVFGVMYFYNSREFVELLLALPIKRNTIFLGQYIGIAGSLSLSLGIGLGLPFLIFGLLNSGAIVNFLMLLVIGFALNFIFVAISCNVALANDNKIKGFGYSILIWLFLAVVYDGLFLIALVVFDEYPLDIFALVASLFNPIDLSRILILLKLDISALLGYTGAVFKQFFGTQTGLFTSLCVLIFWILIPVVIMIRHVNRKDF